MADIDDGSVAIDASGFTVMGEAWPDGDIWETRTPTSGWEFGKVIVDDAE